MPHGRIEVQPAGHRAEVLTQPKECVPRSPPAVADLDENQLSVRGEQPKQPVDDIPAVGAHRNKTVVADRRAG